MRIVEISECTHVAPVLGGLSALRVRFGRVLFGARDELGFQIGQIRALRVLGQIQQINILVLCQLLDGRGDGRLRLLQLCSEQFRPHLLDEVGRNDVREQRRHELGGECGLGTEIAHTRHAFAADTRAERLLPRIQIVRLT